MRKSTILTVCLSITLGYVLATSLNRTTAGQPPLPEPVGQEGQVWRYQLMFAGEGHTPVLFVTDTVTGRVWSRGTHERASDEWHPYGSPAAKASERAPR
jgi:hypothetical protein